MGRTHPVGDCREHRAVCRTSSEAQTSPGSVEHLVHTSAPRGGSPGVTIRQDPPQSPSRPSPPPAGPLVPPAPPSALDSVDLFRAGPRTYAPRYDRVPRRQRFPGGYGGYGYVTDPFGYISQPYAPADDSDPRAADGTGFLRLDVEPETARVYVDGLYVGVVSDFRRAPREFDAGPHRVEIRADGFESQSVEVSIRANDTLSYRGTLTRERAASRVTPGAAEDLLRDSTLLCRRHSPACGSTAGGLPSLCSARSSSGQDSGLTLAGCRGDARRPYVDSIITEAAARSGCTAAATSNPPDTSSSRRRRTPREE